MRIFKKNFEKATAQDDNDWFMMRRKSSLYVPEADRLQTTLRNTKEGLTEPLIGDTYLLDETQATSRRSKLAYKDMDDGPYYLITMLIYVLETLGAMAVANISDIFGFVAAFSINFLCLVLPGLFYLYAQKKYATIS